MGLAFGRRCAVCLRSLQKGVTSNQARPVAGLWLRRPISNGLQLFIDVAHRNEMVLTLTLSFAARL
jgi:hypothetical protein